MKEFVLSECIAVGNGIEQIKKYIDHMYSKERIIEGEKDIRDLKQAKDAVERLTSLGKSYKCNKFSPYKEKYTFD